jgi:hypothetical protein
MDLYPMISLFSFVCKVEKIQHETKSFKLKAERWIGFKKVPELRQSFLCFTQYNTYHWRQARPLQAYTSSAIPVRPTALC